MCGIAGLIQNHAAAPETLAAMRNALRRRGPDAEHIVGWNAQGHRIDEAPEVALVHTRLAIIDPRPEADQPFSNDDGSIWICYNGEVYDWQQHANQLRAQGVQFKTHADTEFILRGYEAWGLEGLLPRLRGMFAFAILDWNKREVFLVRDRMGLKPLIYTTANDGLAFGSLVRSVLPAVPKAQRQFSSESIDAYLAHRYIPAPRTIFQHIHRLENAHYLHYHLDTQQLTKHCYWQPHAEAGSEKNAWKTELDTAIRIRTVADRPLGVFLSGGIDSSTIACRLKEQGLSQFGAQLQTFSAAFPGSQLDESPIAKQIADTLGLPNQAIPVPLTVANDFEQIIADLDEPFADPSSFPTWYLAQATTQHVKVVLGGDGGDELLGGYKRLGKHLRTSWRRLLRIPLPRMADMAGKGWRKIVEELRLNWLEAYSLRFSGMTPGQRAFLQPGLKNPSVTYWRYPAIDALNQLSPIKQLLAVDMNNYLPEYILRKGDLCTMAHGLELRAPLLDHIWAERIMALPNNERFTQPTKKLFAAVTEPLASLDLFNLKKRGFNPPLKPWLQEDLQHRFAGLGVRLQTQSQGQINANRVERLVAEYQDRPALAEQMLQLLILDASLAQLEALVHSC